MIGGSRLVLVIYLAVNTAYLYALPFWQVTSANSTAYPEAPSVAARAVQTFLCTRRRAGARRLCLGARRAVLCRLRPPEPAHACAGHLAGAAVHLGSAAGGLRHLRSAHQHGGDVVRAVLDSGNARGAGAAPQAAARTAALSPAGLSVRAAGVHAGHGVDRDQRTA